jgi:hypothetical protein
VGSTGNGRSDWVDVAIGDRIFDFFLKVPDDVLKLKGLGWVRSRVGLGLGWVRLRVRLRLKIFRKFFQRFSHF